MDARHRAWLASLRFADRASQLTIADYLHSHDVLLARRDRIEAELEQLAASSPWTIAIARLRCLRGIDTAIRARAVRRGRRVRSLRTPRQPELLSRDRPIGEHHRPAAPPRRDHQGRLHPRPQTADRGRLPLPAPAGDRPSARAPPTRPNRQIINIAWRAQRRLNARWRQLKHARRKPNGVVAVAIARELAGFCWEIALPTDPPPDNPLRLARRPEPPRHRAQPAFREQPMSNHFRWPRSMLDSGPCDEIKVLGYPAPAYEADHRREPADARTAPPAATTHQSLREWPSLPTTSTPTP